MYLDKKYLINFEDFINDDYKILAHIEKDRRELLVEHLDLVIKYFYRIVNNKNLDCIFNNIEQVLLKDLTVEAKELFIEMIVNIFPFHDMGKVNPCFQKLRLHNDLNIKSCEPSKNFNHSMMSAVLYINHFFHKIKVFKGNERNVLLDFMIINSYIISRHHGDLNSMEEFKEKFSLDGEGERLLNEESILYKTTYKKEVNLKINTINNVFTKINELTSNYSSEKNICRYIYSKLIFSLLIACDYYATTEFNNGVEIENLGDIDDIKEFYDVFKEGKVYKSIREYESSSYGENKDLSLIDDINILRNEMFLDAEEKLINSIDRSIFYLEAPTGSGKSNTAFNLSFKLFNHDEYLKKIYYIYPFNTLIEQNIETLSKIFEGKKEILSKIAVINSIYPIKKFKKNNEEDYIEDYEFYTKSLLNRQFLNYPVVLSTHVSLFDVMFGSSKESVFAFHQLVNSVVVLDEIQSYKNIIWSEIISFLKVFGKILNMKIIIMSATLPDLNILIDKQTDIHDESVNLISNREKYFSHKLFKERVKVSYELMNKDNVLDLLFEHVKKNSIRKKKILVEFIKKQSAFYFYNRLLESEICSNIELMTGDDNIVERKRILEKIKCKQVRKEGMILIATQVIEAGVDIDMDIGYKDISKLDSEEQFMGRINRSCKKIGEVYFFDLDKANSIYKDDVRINQDLSLLNSEMREILVNKNFKEYYEKVLSRIIENFNDALNENNLQDFFKEKVGSLNFIDVEKRMKLIDDKNWSMSLYFSSVIKYEKNQILDGEDIWNEYEELLKDNAMDYAEKQVKLSIVKSKMNYFIYEIKKNVDLPYNKKIGELYYLENGEEYFEGEKLNKDKFEKQVGRFIEL